MLFGGGALIWMPVGGKGVMPHRHWIVPHAHPHRPGPQGLGVGRIEAKVDVKGQIATTELVLTFKNPGGRPAEGRALLPVPGDATLKSFAMEGGNTKMQAKLLPRKEARRIYDEIVRSLKDPAILEFAGLGAVQTGVFPVPAGKEVRLRMVYQQLLVAEGESGHITLRVLRKKKGYAFEVCDEGRGVNGGEKRRLFRAFHKSALDAAHDKPGVGLGLALCRRLARALGGDLRLGRKSGNGACFVLQLP